METIDKNIIRSFVLSEVTKRNIQPDFSDDDNLLSTGILDSLFAVDLIYFIEKSYKIKILDESSPKSEQINTINKIYDWVLSLDLEK